MAPPYVRRDVWSLAADDPIIRAYAGAVETMQRRDPTDPTSWTYQAAVHGSYSTPALELWNTCEHGSWYFVAWHRMYVYYFECIVRSVVVANGGPEDWALPYWNYTPPDGNPSLPPAFREEGSPLYVWQRRITPYNVNAGAPLPAAVTSTKQALDTIPFVPTSIPSTGFGGQVTSPVHLNGGFGALEQRPHNVVHDSVGGPYGWMADVNFAAQDPIFWLHHANIDRLWALWCALGGGRSDPSEPAWTSQAFSFYDDTGTTQSKTPGEIEDTLALGYTYDPKPSPPPVESTPSPAPALEAEFVGASPEPIRLTGGRTVSTVTVDARARDSVLEGGRARQVLLSLDDIEADKNPGTVYGVYVNLPDGATDEDAQAHLAGPLSFFGIEGSGKRADDTAHVHAYHAGYDITELVDVLSARGLWDDQHVDVTFHPLGLPLNQTPEAEADLPVVTVGRISVHYAR